MFLGDAESEGKVNLCRRRGPRGFLMDRIPGSGPYFADGSPIAATATGEPDEGLRDGS